MATLILLSPRAMFAYKPDFEVVMNRFEAWWACEIVDRPPVSIRLPQTPDLCVPLPQAPRTNLRDRWMDTEFVVDRIKAGMQNSIFYAEDLPVAFPNLGPEIFSAFYGCELEFGESTSWSKPVLKDWSDTSLDALQIDSHNEYFAKILELTDALIDAGRDHFIVGHTDLHGGGDAIAAFRDPQNLLLDTLENPEAVKTLIDRITPDFLRVYDLYHEKLSAAGMPSTTWLPATCRGKYYVAGNDFSCMISETAFDDLFVPGIIRECRHMDRCIYHLDGPQALRHLDRLLDIPEIHAIQWVPGAGRDYWADWIHVYRRIQARGKALVTVTIAAAELPRLFDALRPEGVWIGGVSGISNREEADAILDQVARWSR